MNVFSKVVTLVLSIFPAFAVWDLLKNMLLLFVQTHWDTISTNAFMQLLGNLNYFIPVDLIFWIAGFHFTFMVTLLIFKWTLKLIPFIG